MYEEHRVRIEAGYNLHEWDALSMDDRAFEVAHFRLRHLVEAHIYDWNEKHPKKGKNG